ncbi:MAG: TIGR03943 family protein [Chloroflexi bacterium]|nr:TIGR03943 family protein [Chloroflexota bacterium]
MSDAMQDRIKALILVLTAAYLTYLLVSGNLFFYIGPRFSWLVILGIGLMVILASSYRLVGPKADDTQPIVEDVYLYNDYLEADRPKTGLVALTLVALPLLLGVTVPARPLDASAVPNRGVSTELASADPSQSLTIVAGERNVLDWVRTISNSDDPAALNGEEFDAVGFVYRDTRFGEDEFMVARFTMTCCAADAMAIGVIIRSDEAADFETNSWVRVQGSFTEGDFDGDALPIVSADSIDPANEPEQPYLFP